MTTRSNIESQIKNVRKRVSAEAAKRKKQVAGLRAKAAEAALHWVISHEDRVNAFRSSVKGTPVAKALDALIDMLKKSGAKPAAKKRPAAKKAAAKKKPAARKASARKK
jgi:DNA-binding protein H-NS